MPPTPVVRVWPDIIADGAPPGGLGYYGAMPFSDPRLLRGTVRVPTTHVWSDRLKVLEGVSHWIPDEMPERLAEIERVGRAGPR